MQARGRSAGARQGSAPPARLHACMHASCLLAPCIHAPCSINASCMPACTRERTSRLAEASKVGEDVSAVEVTAAARARHGDDLDGQPARRFSLDGQWSMYGAPAERALSACARLPRDHEVVLKAPPVKEVPTWRLHAVVEGHEANRAVLFARCRLARQLSSIGTDGHSDARGLKGLRGCTRRC